MIALVAAPIVGVGVWYGRAYFPRRDVATTDVAAPKSEAPPPSLPERAPPKPLVIDGGPAVAAGPPLTFPGKPSPRASEKGLIDRKAVQSGEQAASEPASSYRTVAATPQPWAKLSPTTSAPGLPRVSRRDDQVVAAGPSLSAPAMSSSSPIVPTSSITPLRATVAEALAFPKPAATRSAPAALREQLRVAPQPATVEPTQAPSPPAPTSLVLPKWTWASVSSATESVSVTTPAPTVPDVAPAEPIVASADSAGAQLPAAAPTESPLATASPEDSAGMSVTQILGFPRQAASAPAPIVEGPPSLIPLPAIVDSHVRAVAAPPAPVMPQQPTPPQHDAPLRYDPQPDVAAPSAPPSVPASVPAAFPTSVPDPWAGLAAVVPAYEPPDAATITIDQVRYLALANNKDIAVLGYAPQIAATAIGEEAAVFDPVFNVNTQGGHYDRQTSTQINALGSDIPELKTTFLNPGLGLNQAYVEKLFVTGGRVQAGIGQNLTSYSPTGDFVFVNPAWQSSLNVLVEQPLFRGRGRVATEARLQIARANQAQSWHSFQATVNQVLRDAETAYWETYGAYRELSLRELALAQALQTVEREQERMRIGESAIPDVAQAVEHAEEFRIERADAENRYVAAQRELRRVMGVPADDARSLVPATEAVDAPLVVDLVGGADQALARPELAAQRAAVAAAEAECARRRNGLQPDLAVRGIYSVSGLDSQFDAAWSSLGRWNYNDWTAGVVYRQPLGRRADQSLAERATAALSMENARLSQMQHGIMHQLAAAAEAVQAAERMLELHRRRREAAAVQLEARRALYLEGKAELRDQLDAEERYAAAILDEALARVDYQRALTDWNFARGAMNQDAVVLAQ